ncbi:MAG: MFS transporter [Pseudomonadota bacterium]|jgi:1-acyl-sn-glycerol-3-phosphate acyltransferase
MSGSNQFSLLRQRRFLPFFLTQSLGAFNDNVFKNALVALVTFVMTDLSEQQQTLLTNLAAALFIAPFFLFSATAGQLAEKYDKALLARAIKLLEVAIMAFAAAGFLTHHVEFLLAMVFMMGLHSTLFGPLKYSIMPQVLAPDELVGGNGLVEMGTFVAILGGSLLGSALIQVEGAGPWLVSGACIVLALAGLATALAMPRVPPPVPDLRLRWNVFAETAANLRYLAGNRTVFLACLGVSWFWFFGSVYFVQLPNYAKTVLGGDGGVYQFLLAVFSIGVALGSLLCERLSGHKVEIGLVPFGSLGMTAFGIDIYFARPDLALATGASLGELFAHGWMWRLTFDLAMMAVFCGFFIVPLFALIQTRSERSHQSRVIAANNILNALFMVAATGIAVLLLNVAGLTIPQLLLVMAVFNAVVAIYIYTLVPEFLWRFVAWLLVGAMYRLEVHGRDKIPDQGACILVCNHVSFMDAVILMGAVRRPTRFVMYWKIFQIPVVKWLFRAARAIPIAGRGENEALMLRAFDVVDRELGAGEVVGIFPEGGITRDGTLQPFRPGIERMLAKRPVPVVPMALRGMWGSLFSRKDRLRLPRRFRSRIALVVGDPIPAGEVTAALLEQRVRELRGDWA